ncbi:hypothetical protein BRYFOR_07387 [Marvinbryantia formatexigens DSM 14469]|uniref:MORN repeat protein n=1 Tax=Marvinbryantia formatexigens DSM 14469 TaxID=478749 RepID=C6LFI4_9FIRM|nr:MORN motif protein [Marvinbryantia formatexigens]EET60569.1 hypothetical protein BRYFOR_07387 [Marvinbryantia formatexigens DSM 14469]UWO25564.1 hypothetical protein NQ534_03510 [Marvinbryantia formatexigens DSM 14469]SDG19628.1 MORN repeat-containing protein [Marvinbryantia formatexigens]
MKKAFKFIYFLFFLLLFSENAFAEDNDKIAVTIFSDTYYGTYEGNMENGVPAGDGTLTCSDDSADFTLTGTWEAGILNGKATINYSDGSYLTASFKDGLISGRVKDCLADGSYRVYSCTDGRPYKFITYYDASGNETGVDAFYQMQPVSSLKDACIEPEYGLMLNSFYSTTPYKISGTVLGTFDDSTSTFVLLEDGDEHIYVLTYKNVATDKYNQAIVPNLVTGDTITAYGFLQKCDVLSSISDYRRSVPVTSEPDSSALPESILQSEEVKTENLRSSNSTVPFLLLFAADVRGEAATDRLAPSYEYDDVARNPYLYSDLSCSITGEVTQAQINYENGTVSIRMEESGTQNKYVVRYTFSDGDSIPAIGDTIVVDGAYAGNSKALSEADRDTSSDETDSIYIIYPRINSKSVRIL